MTDAEINRALALKIGYLPEHVRVIAEICIVRRYAGDKIKIVGIWLHGWREFDFMDWQIIMPIAVKYGMDMSHFAKSTAAMARLPFKHYIIAPTLQRAIALAVLGAKE